MPDPFYQIFKKPSDHNNWDKQIEFYTKSTEITDDRRIRILEALDYLRIHLSNGFLKNTKNKHPLRFSIANKATHSIDWLIWVYETLKSYEHDKENFKIILNKLKSFGKAVDEGIPFLEVASALQKNGFEVEFEPNIDGYDKKPDLKLTNTKNEEVIYIEVSRVKESDRRDNIMHSYTELNTIMMMAVGGKKIAYAGGIRKLIKQKDIARLSNQIRDFVAQFEAENKFNVLTLEETKQQLELAIADNSDNIKLQEWISQKELRLDNIQNPAINFAEDVDRIINNKIKKEAKQIPTDHVGFIYLKVHPLVIKTGLPWDVAQKVKRKLTKFDHIVGVMLWSNALETVKDPVTINLADFLYSEFSVSELGRRTMLLILNKNYTKKISADSLKKILKSMEVH